ncbi:MAG: KH domain-containing protein [Chloroflexi bacterium]|nr:KH domain-containing protein [Chloroflexota bacterium]
MKELVEYVAKSLVEDPSEVRVEVFEETRMILLRLTVAPDDTGRVIGRDGRVAQALRSLLRSMASKTGKRVTLKIS